MDKAFKVSFAKAQSVLNKFRYKPRKQWSNDDRVLFKLCNFAVLSRKRLNQILLSLDKLSKLSDKSHYKYNEFDIKLLKELILEKLDNCFEKFKHKISVIKESDLQKIKEHLNNIKNENLRFHNGPCVKFSAEIFFSCQLYVLKGCTPKSVHHYCAHRLAREWQSYFKPPDS